MNESDAGSPESAPAKARKPRKSAARKRAEPVTSAAAPATVVELVRAPLSVRWRDLDAFNHVNNAKYLSFLEEARLGWMMGLPGQGLEDDVAPVVAAATLNFRRPIAWPAEVMIELFVERLGNTSVTIGHRILDAGDRGVLYCDGNVVMVWIGRDSGRAAPLPDEVRKSCTMR